ncbi:MAG TPA: sulfite exporter TauE/SafE family protein [Candidatus Limnocylindria bacterium]|nr:sulfite exporter TauE/SafE family protein [Candidatus Limnocylindria bacterium]
MADLVIAWYSWLSGLTQGPILVIQGWIEGNSVPPVSALLFGLIGATAPCQLTTNLGALAWSASRAGTAPVLGASLAYVAGKVLVYSVVGGLVVVLGLQLQGASIPVVVVTRKLLGPLMLLVGLGLLGLVRLPGGFGLGPSRRLAGQVSGGGRGAFLLGVAFSFAFCPTLFWLFFGLTVPLALRSPAGWSFPAVFALGTAIPLLALAAVVSLGWGAADRLAGGVARWHRSVTRVAGAAFIVAGLHDTLIYWWL